MAQRLVEAEILDALPADDVRAVASRRDLRRVNALMGNARLIARMMTDRPAPRRIVEIGCGDGTLSLRLARLFAPSWPGVEVVLIDRLDLVTLTTQSGFAALGWRVVPLIGDVFDVLPRCGAADALFCNLFLHHFDGAALTALLAAVARAAPLVAACEPRRATAAAIGSRLLGAIGCNGVTRHDAAVSVRAGFTGGELTAFWPEPGWHLEEGAAGVFSHVFRAVRA